MCFCVTLRNPSAFFAFKNCFNAKDAKGVAKKR